MISLVNIKKYLRQELSSKRYKHSVNVSKLSAELAARYGCDIHKAEIAGLVHDCTRNMTKDIHMRYIQKLNISLDDICQTVEELLHSISAVYVCKELFLIEDMEILNAVRYHTTGKPDMTLMEKIIFLADIIEPSREFKGVDELRKAAFENLDEAVLLALNSSLSYIISKNHMIHPDSIAARNFLLFDTNI